MDWRRQGGRFRPLEILILALGLGVAVLVGYSAQLTSRAARATRRVVVADETLRSKVVLSHLWLEEAVAGDTTVDVESQVYGNLEAARATCGDMLTERAGAGRLCDRLTTLLRLTERRVERTGASGAGTPIDQSYDAAFLGTMRLARNIRDRSEAFIAEEDVASAFVDRLVIALLLLVFAAVAALVRRHDHALRHLTRRNELILESAGEGIYGLDHEGRCVFVNPAAALMTGHEPAELIGRSMGDVLGGAASGMEAAHMREGQFRRRNGSTFAVEYTAMPVEESGVDAGWVVTFRDISDRKQSLEALAQSEQRFRRMFEEGPVGMALVSRTGHYIQTNETLCRMLGYSETELRRMTVFEITHPDDRAGDADQARRVFAGQMRSYVREKRYLRKDGEVVWTALRVAAITDRSGEVVHALGIVEDITKRKRTEEVLQRSRAQLAEAQQLAHLGSWDADLKTGEIEWSDELFRLVGAGRTSLQPTIHTFLEFVHPDDRELMKATIEEALQDRACFTLDHRLVRSDGEVRVVHSTGRVFIDDDGNENRLAGIAHDVTEQRRVERLKDEFTSIVSHELRTPLTSIRGALNLLSAGALGPLPEKGQRMIEIASSNTDRLVRLVNDLLDIERLESGSVAMRKEDCDAADLMNQASEVMQAMAHSAGVNLVVSPVHARLWANPDRIIQTLINLISNAIKFSPRTGRVSVDARVDEGIVTFSVHDEGRGIPPDQLESIFGRFQQVSADDSRKKGGTGLGLAICRNIVQQHAGSIWAESVPLRGSTLSFTLPVKAEEKQVGEEPDGPTILVCDDDPAVLEVVDALLHQRGYRVISTASGEDAIARAVEEKPAAILLDLIMPDMTTFGAETGEDAEQLAGRTSPDLVLMNVTAQAHGFDLIEQLRHDDGVAGVPMVVYGSDGSAEVSGPSSVEETTAGQGPTTLGSIDGSITDLLSRLSNAREKRHGR